MVTVVCGFRPNIASDNNMDNILLVRDKIRAGSSRSIDFYSLSFFIKYMQYSLAKLLSIYIMYICITYFRIITCSD